MPLFSCLLFLSEGVKNISNQLTISTEISAEHPELRSTAQAQGWWDGEREFNFSEVFSPENPPARMELAKQRYKGGKELLQQHNGEAPPLHNFAERLWTFCDFSFNTRCKDDYLSMGMTSTFLHFVN